MPNHGKTSSTADRDKKEGTGMSKGTARSTLAQRHGRSGTRLLIFSSIALMGALAPQVAQAIPASPLPFEAIQPDGSRITLHVRGDEYFHWYEDLNGYTAIPMRWVSTSSQVCIGYMNTTRTMHHSSGRGNLQAQRLYTDSLNSTVSAQRSPTWQRTTLPEDSRFPSETTSR